MTDAVTPAPSLPDLPSGRFSGREAFMQLVRDDDDRLAVLFHVAHDGEELFRLTGEDRGFCYRLHDRI